MDPIIGMIREDLQNSADAATKQSFSRFFKEEVRGYGVKTAVVGKIAEKYWKEVRSKDKNEIFRLCEELYRSQITEEAFVVSFWVPHLKDRFEREDFDVFKYWIGTYISNWAMCDGFCNHTIGDFLVMFPEFIDRLKSWTKSENRWVRRASAVSLIVPAKRGHFLPEVLEIAGLLLTDEDDLVRKGYGWLLKEASRKHENEVFEFIMRNRRVMPRTALRYAVERMPEERRMEAMKKNW
ncbi:MAG TPA: DNA alkylation repair protein [Methanoregulaceae archaeon]|nr:DNA alkylation repair protein [Methanoregulaceae archaeon]